MSRPAELERAGRGALAGNLPGLAARAPDGLVVHEQHDGDDPTGLFDVDDLLDQFVHGAIIMVDELGHQQVTRNADRGIDF